MPLLSLKSHLSQEFGLLDPTCYSQKVPENTYLVSNNVIGAAQWIKLLP